MPFENEHACRVNDPGKYERFRRQKGKGDQPDMIFGIKGDGSSEVQSYRFPTSRFSATKAKGFCQRHNGTFEKAAKSATLRLVPKTGRAVSISAEIAGDTGPSRRFRKHLISVGQYVKEDQGYEFSVNRADLQRWADTFDEMKQNGVTVPMPDAHETFGEAAHNLGYVEEMFVEGDDLIGIVKLIGEDAIATAARADVSISVPPEFVDGKGNRYQQPIEHVAFTPTPLIPGLDPFVPLAASRKWREECTVMDWTTLEKVLSLEGLNDDNACEQIAKAFESRTKETETLQASLKATEGRLKGIEASLKEAQAKAKPEPEKLGAVTLNLARDTQTAQLDMLVDAAKITPAVRDGLHALFIGENGERIQASAANGTHGLFKDVVALFGQNDPVKLGEQTGPQTTMRLSRQDGSRDDSLEKLAEARAKARMAG